MKIALMTHDTRLYSVKRLIEAARARNHDIRALKTAQLVICTSPEPQHLFSDGAELGTFDAVIPRIGKSITRFGTAVLRQFEAMGTIPLNSSEAILRSRDKFHALQCLSQGNIAIPPTVYAIDAEQASDLAQHADGPPTVIKLLEGAEGAGVMLAETKASAQAIYEGFRDVGADVLMQAYCAEAAGRDIRALVVGGEVVAAMERTSPDGDFRANLHRGGNASQVELTHDETQTAISAADILGLNVCGVDMLRSKQGPLVLEVNSTPGLEGIETITGVDVASAIIAQLEALTETRSA